MTRLRVLSTLAAFLLPLSACDKLTESTDSESAEPTVSVVLSRAEIHPLDTPDFTTATIIAKAPAQGMSLSAMILDASNKVVTDQFTTDFTPTPASSDSNFSTSAWKITSKSTSAIGNYSLKVIVTDKKGKTASQSANFRVTADAEKPRAELRIDDWSGWGDVSAIDFASPSGKLVFTSSFVELSLRIHDREDRDVTDEFFVEIPSEVTSSPYDLVNLSVIARGAATGDYAATLTATDAQGAEIKKQWNFSVIEGNFDDLVAEGPVTLGAQGSSSPSFLQIQGGNLVTWTSSTANRPFQKIDLVLGVDGEGNLSLMSPHQANGDGFSLSSWTTLNSTEFVGLGTDIPASRTEVETRLDEGGYGGAYEKVEVLPEYYYAARLTTGEVVVLRVGSVSGSGRDASIELTAYYYR